MGIEGKSLFEGSAKDIEAERQPGTAAELLSAGATYASGEWYLWSEKQGPHESPIANVFSRANEKVVHAVLEDAEDVLLHPNEKVRVYDRSAKIEGLPLDRLRPFDYLMVNGKPDLVIKIGRDSANNGGIRVVLENGPPLYYEKGEQEVEFDEVIRIPNLPFVSRSS